MKAVVIERPGRVRQRDVPEPELLSGEVLVRPQRGGFCKTDVHIFEGDFIGTYPVIPCHELSGVVVRKGPGADLVSEGDRVCVDPNIRCGQCPACRSGEVNLCDNYQAVGVTRPGGFAESVAIPVQNVYKFLGRDFSSMAFSEPLACVLYGQSRLRIVPGSRVAVWGAGSIGLLHLQVFGRLRGCEVVVVDQDPRRLERAESLGAQQIVQAGRFMDRRLKDIAPKGWDIGIEATGNVEGVRSLMPHVRRGGQILVFGVYPKTKSVPLLPFDVFYNDWSIHGSLTYRHEFSEAVRILEGGLIQAVTIVDRTIPMAEAPDMLRSMAKGKRMGKVHVEI